MNLLSKELIAISKSPFMHEGLISSGTNEFQAAVIALFQGERFLHSKILLTLRSDQLSTHAGQFAFPGGAIDKDDSGSPINAALRECHEEVGILPSQIQIEGALPAFPTNTGSFLVTPVLGQTLSKEISLTLEAREVVLAEWVSVQALIRSRTVETRILKGVTYELPVFLWDHHKMWGLTALIFDLILSRYDRL